MPILVISSWLFLIHVKNQSTWIISPAMGENKKLKPPPRATLSLTHAKLSSLVHAFLTCPLFLPHLYMHTPLGGSLLGFRGFRVSRWGHNNIHGAWTHWMQQPRLSSLAHAFPACSCNHFSFLSSTCAHL